MTLPRKIWYEEAWRDLREYVWFNNAWKLISDSTALTVQPSTIVHREWSFARGSDQQVIYDVGPNAVNGQRGSAVGTDTNDFTWSSTPGYASFDGTNDYGTGTTSMTWGNGDFTIAALVRIGAGVDKKAITVGSGAGGAAVGIGSSGSNIGFVIYGDDTPSTTAYGTGWRLVFMTYVGSTRVITGYAGLTQIATKTRGGNLSIPANAAVHFGKPTWATAEYWGGDIARVVIYNKALTTGEMTSERLRISSISRAQGIDSTDFPAATSTQVAYTAFALRDSVGVCTHANYDSQPYQNLPLMGDYILEAGFARIRDGMKRFPQASNLTFFKRMIDNGVKVTLIMGDPTGRDGQLALNQATGTNSLVSLLKGSYDGRVTQLEGPNEWDSTGTGWQTSLANFYAQFKAAIRADSVLNAKFPVIYGGSMAQGFNFQSYTDNNQEGAVLHPYPGGEIPEGNFITQQIGYARASAGPGKPVIATEAGYTNSYAYVGGDGNKGVPQDVDAHYTIREYLYNLFVGIKETYKYQLVDPNPDDSGATDKEQLFGTIEVTGTGTNVSAWTLTRKPVFNAIKRMQAYLADAGTGSYPTTVPFGLSSVPANVVVIPISRKDGTYDIAAWLKNPLWTTATRTTVADTTATLGISFPNASTVDSFSPSVGTSVTRLGTSVTSLNVTLNGKVQFLRVTAG